MAETPDLYEVLGVARGADLDTIRKAYRKLARQTHPDLNPGDAAAEARFKEISNAWSVLEDPDRRRDYDEFGNISLEAGFDAAKARQSREAFGARFGSQDPRGRTGAEHDFQFGDLDDLFRGAFGGSSRGHGIRMQGNDLEASLELDFVDAIQGGEQRLTMNRLTEDGSQRRETITVRIPPGVDTGGRLRLAGKGAPGVGGGPPGDLHVKLRVRPHPVFRRRGRDLELDLPVTLREATLGGRIEVPTLDGRVTLAVPPGTDSGRKLRLRGKGVAPASGGDPGDLLVRVQIHVPRDLDDDAKAALEQLERFEDPDIRKELFQ